MSSQESKTEKLTVFGLLHKIKQDTGIDVNPILNHISAQSHEIDSLRSAELGKWSLWHDGFWRMFNLKKGMIGTVKRDSKDHYIVGFKENDGYALSHDELYGTVEEAKRYVEAKLGLLES